LKELKIWCKKNKIPLAALDDGTLGGVYACGAYIFVLITPGRPHWETIDTLVHESVHVFQKTMEYIGEKEIGDEVEAYHIGSIAVNMMKDFHALHEKR
jgi:hypothetical protein